MSAADQIKQAVTNAQHAAQENAEGEAGRDAALHSGPAAGGADDEACAWRETYGGAQLGE
jgi:hypothetical protein